MIPPAHPRRFWESRVNALTRRINLAAWLARVAPTTFFVASVFAVAVYALRRLEAPVAYGWAALGVALMLGVIGSWLRARREFYAAGEARVLLEAQLRLDTRLTAAELGLVSWPERPAALPEVMRWNLRAPLAWMASAAALLALAWALPIPRDAVAIRPGSPPALLQTEAMLTAVKEMNVAEPEALKHWEERLNELSRRPAEEQYSHSGLEAADALRDQTALATAGLARGLESAADALSAANDGADLTGPAGQLSAALAGLRDGVFPANKETLAGLPASAGQLANLTPQQRAELAQRFSQLANQLGGVAGANSRARMGRGERGTYGQGAGQGAGGPGGGGRSAPLMLADNPSAAEAGKAEALTGDALDRVALGDKIGASASAHEVDPNKSVGPTAAGAVAAPASGGEAVWVNRLTPTERAALKHFFK